MTRRLSGPRRSLGPALPYTLHAPSAEAGSSLLEFSLLLPLVVFMFFGIVDLSLAISQAITVAGAAEAGALYGTLAGNANDSAGMQNAAVLASNGLSGFAATATTWCSCTSAGAPVSCSSSCSNSASPIEYVQVQTTATASILAHYPGLPTSIPLSGFSVLRVQ